MAKNTYQKTSMAAFRVLQKVGQSSQLNWALLDQAVVSGSNFLIGILLVRLLGIEQYGIYVLLWMVVQFAMSIQAAVLISPAQSISPKLLPADVPEYLGSIQVLQVMLIAAGVGVSLIAVVVGAAWQPDWWSAHLLLPIIACLIFYQLQDYSRRILFIISMPEKAFFIDVIAYGMQVLLLLVLFSGRPSFDQALWLVALSFATSSLIGFRYCRFSFSGTSSLKASISRHWVSSRWLLGSAMLQWLSGNYFLVISAALLGPAAVGAIRAAQNLLGITHIAFQGLENIVPVQASRTFAQYGISALRSYLRKVLIIMVCGTAVAAVVLSIFVEPIFSLVYGKLEPDSTIAVFWYVPIYILIAACLPYRSGLRTLEKTRVIFIAYVLGAIFSLLFASLLVSEYGIHGTMLGILIVQLIMVASLAIAFSRGITEI